MQADNELGKVLMRAFILRRTELIARGIGDLVLVGSNHSVGTLRIREFISRDGARSPYFLETSIPHVFAVGDVKAGNLKCYSGSW